jgi:hypothetical protein
VHRERMGWVDVLFIEEAGAQVVCIPAYYLVIIISGLFRNACCSCLRKAASTG